MVESYKVGSVIVLFKPHSFAEHYQFRNPDKFKNQVIQDFCLLLI